MHSTAAATVIITTEGSTATTENGAPSTSSMMNVLSQDADNMCDVGSVGSLQQTEKAASNAFGSLSLRSAGGCASAPLGLVSQPPLQLVQMHSEWVMEARRCERDHQKELAALRRERAAQRRLRIESAERYAEEATRRRKDTVVQFRLLLDQLSSQKQVCYEALQHV
jgi:hypothetical protein